MATLFEETYHSRYMALGLGRRQGWGRREGWVERWRDREWQEEERRKQTKGIIETDRALRCWVSEGPTPYLL